MRSDSHWLRNFPFPGSALLFHPFALQLEGQRDSGHGESSGCFPPTSPPPAPRPGICVPWDSVDLPHGDHCPSVFLKLNFSSKSSLLFLWPGLGQNESVGIKICFIQFREVGLCICYSYIILTEQAKKCARFTAHDRIWLRNELLKEVALQSGPWTDNLMTTVTLKENLVSVQLQLLGMSFQEKILILLRN